MDYEIRNIRKNIANVYRIETAKLQARRIMVRAGKFETRR